MKNQLIFLILTFISFNCFAQEVEELPETPWRMIVETQNSHFPNKWNTDINIKLMGNYSHEDSIMIENSVELLNSFLKTIKLKVTKHDRGNLEILFLDSTNSRSYAHIISISSGKNSQYYISHLNSKVSNLFVQAINIQNIPKKDRQNYLTNTLTFALYPTYWNDQLHDRNIKKNESIFRFQSIEDRDKLYFEDIHEYDIKLIQKLYSFSYEEKFEVAKKQFQTPVHTPSWVKENPSVFLLIPFGVLLLIFLPVFFNVTRKIKQKVSSDILAFNLNGLIGAVIIGLIAAAYFYLIVVMKNDYFSLNKLLNRLLIGLIVAIVVGIPAINLLRLIELLIYKNTERRVLKIVLTFLSTGLIPFSVVFAFYYFVIAKQLPGRALGSSDFRIMSYFLSVFLIIAGFRALISFFFFKEKDLILENETKLSKLRELKSKAELNALHSRINPHFLYNSLNSIAGLAHDDAEKTEHMALSLSKLFRYSINKEKSDWTTFKEELEMVRIYLDVEKVRFDDRLTYSVTISEALENQKIPRFIIQPLVENAVKHGISKSVSGGKIKVEISREGKNTTIAVSDSGPAFPDDLTPGFGIQSIYDKLEILYKDKFEMNFTNSPQKQVTLKLKK